MENTYSKNCGVEDESSHPTHPWGPALKKKSVAKAKIFFLLKVNGQSKFCTNTMNFSFAEYHTDVCSIQRKPIVAPHLTDRNWSVAVKVGKRIWLGRSRMLASPAQNSEKQTAKIHSPARTPSRGPSALYFFTRNTRKTQKSTFPLRWLTRYTSLLDSSPETQFTMGGWEG